MKKILVITGIYWPKPSANGLCLDALLKEFYAEGYFSEVVALSDYENELMLAYCNVHNIKINRARNLGANPIKNIMNSFQFLFSYPFFTRKEIRTAEKTIDGIMNREDIDFVFAVQKPATSSLLGIKTSQKYQKPLIIYELDSLSDNASNYCGYTRFFKMRTFSFERRVFSKANCIFFLKSHMSHYGAVKYKSFAKKLHPIDVPLLDRDLSLLPQNTTRNCKEVFLVYSGVLDRITRNPMPVIEFVEALNQIKKTKCFFYQKGNVNEMLEAKEMQTGGAIVSRPYVPRDELDLQVASSDYLISIGVSQNSVASTSPSKIIYYMSFGKPIIHFANSSEDFAISYLEKYPLSIVFFKEETISDRVQKFLRFDKERSSKAVTFDNLENLFPDNVPSRSAQFILEVIGGIRK